MRRGDLYRVSNPRGDPRRYRVFVIVSRQVLVSSKFSSLICAPVFTNGQGLATQVVVGVEEGLKHQSWIMCDNLVSVHKTELTQYVGSLSNQKTSELNQALRMALDLA